MLYISDQKRTLVFAKAIEQRLRSIASQYDKSVFITQITPNPDLFLIRSSGSFEAEYYARGENPVYVDWLKGKYSSAEGETVDECSTRVSRFLNYAESAVTNSQSERVYTIIIGITHSYVIDAYIFRQLTSSHDNHVIATADFIKKECGNVYFESRWY